MERKLRDARPQPPAELVESTMRRLGAPEAPARSSRRRLALAFALTLALGVGIAALGGLGYARSAATESLGEVSRAAANFVAPTSSKKQDPASNLSLIAAEQTYPRPRLKCRVTFGTKYRKVRVHGTTTLASGTIRVRVADRTPPRASGFPWRVTVDPATRSWRTPRGPKTLRGHMYVARVTQVAPGYGTARTSCRARVR